MKWFTNLFKGRRERLRQLQGELENMAEATTNSQEDSLHRACTSLASGLVKSYDCQLTNDDRIEMKQLVEDLTRQDYGKGLHFTHPWAARAAILREMYQLRFPN
jgi:hypothetical protein